MEIEIYINANRVDTDDQTKLSETKQVNDFFEIKDRQTSRTNSFKIPMTARNVMIFQMLGIVGNNTVMPYRIARIDVKRNGITTIENGRAIIKETDLDSHYNIHAYDGNIDLYGYIDQLKISELDFSDILSGKITQDTWLNSLTNTWVDGFIFPLADYGNVDTVVECNYQAPALFIKYLWEKIFSEAGFTYTYVGENNIFESEEFKESVISITEGYSNDTDANPQVLKLHLAKSGSFFPESDLVSGNQFLSTNPSNETHYVSLNELEDPDNLHITSASTAYNRSRIRIQQSGYYKIDSNLTSSGNNLSSASLYIEKNGLNFLFLGSFSDPNKIQQVIRYVYLEENDEIFVKFSANYLNQNASFNYDLDLKVTLDNSSIILNFNQYYQSIGQKEFIKDVMHHYGLLFQRKGKTYQFISIEDLLTNQGNREDWSAKFDSAISEDYKIGDYGQRNIFKYSYQEDEVNFADASFTIDDETLKSEHTILTRIFAAPANSTKRINNRLLKSVPLWQKSVDDLGNVTDIKPKKAKPYLMRLDRTNGSVDYKFYSDGAVSTFVGDIPYASFIGMDHNNIIANRYSAFSNLLNKGKKMKSRLYLNELDLYELDFFKLKYIRQLGQLFYLNKIENFQNKKLTVCEFIQVRRFVNRGEYNDDYSADYNI